MVIFHTFVFQQELHKLKQSHDAPPQRKGIEKISSKLVGEHEKLRKDYGKEIEASKMLKVKIAALENDLKDKNDEIRRLEGRLREAESRVPNLEGLDSKQWKSAVATRMFEQKVKSLEGELEKKVNFEIVLTISVDMSRHTFFSFFFCLA